MNAALSDWPIRGRLRPSLPSIDDMIVEQARALLRSQPAVSLHDHPVRLPKPLTRETWTEWRESRADTIWLDGLARSGASAYFASANSWHSIDDLWHWARTQTGLIEADSRFALTLTTSELVRAHEHAQTGPRAPIGILLALETIDRFGDLGAASAALMRVAGFRMVGFAYDRGNAFGGGLGSQGDAGLTTVGRDMVKALNEAGIIIDLSHVGDKTASQVIRLSQHPVVFSHAGARAVWPIPRLKPDWLLKELAAHGGVIGVETAPNSTISPRRSRHDLDSVLDHVDYLIDLLGPEHVGVGPDTMFGDHRALHRLLETPGVPEYSYTPTQDVPSVEDIDFVQGAENPSETLLNIAAGMLSRGHAESLVAKVLGGNAIRVMQHVLP